MKRYLFFGLLSGFVLTILSCSNIYQGASSKTTDLALLEDARKALNALDFDTAISKITTLQAGNPSYATDVDTKMLLASAYAGKCGFNFMSYIQTITTSSNGATPIMKWLMNQWTTANTARSYCTQSENVVKSISATYVGRSADQSLFLVLLGLAKIGIYLRELTDLNRDGVADNPPFDHSPSPGSFCSSANISDANIAEVGVGLALIVANLANVGTALSGSNLGSLTTFCGTLGAPATNPCYLEDETAFAANAAYLKTIRSVLNTAATGLDSGGACP